MPHIYKCRICRQNHIYFIRHYCDVIMSQTASQITSLTIVYSIVDSGTDQRKHQSSASLAFVRGIHRGPVNSPHKWPVTRKMFPFDDVIMKTLCTISYPSLTLNIMSQHFVWIFKRCYPGHMHLNHIPSNPRADLEGDAPGARRP